MTSMVEWVGLAIVRQCGVDAVDDTEWPQVRALGRAAIEAMREPTEKMLSVDDGDPASVWDLMISAALDESE